MYYKSQGRKAFNFHIHNHRLEQISSSNKPKNVHENICHSMYQNQKKPYQCVAHLLAKGGDLISFYQQNLPQIRGVASRKQVRGPQHNILTIANVKQDIESILKYGKSEGAIAPLGPIVATPVLQIIGRFD